MPASAYPELRLDKYTDQHGLNPTRRLLLGVLKYPASYTETVQEHAYGTIVNPRWLSKASEQHPPKCYMDDEQDVVDWILDVFSREERVAFKTLNQQGKHLKPIYKALDTSIMELADDISYSLHDLEDAISLGMISRKDWELHNQGQTSLFTACFLDEGNLAKELFAEESYQRKRTIGGLVHTFITHICVVESNISSASTSLLKWNAYMVEAYQALLKHIFDLVLTKVIKSANVQQLEFKGQKLLVELFDALSSDPERLLPISTQKRHQSADSESKKMRVICDYIAGMTDEYATRLYEKLYSPHKGSIFDRL